MKRNLYLFSLLMGFVLAGGCKKETPEDPKPESTSVQQLSQDDNHAETFTDEALNDVNILMSQQGLKSVAEWPCNATIDSAVTQNDTTIYYITYHGPNCNGTLTRTGKVEIRKKVGMHWFMPGATVLVRFINLKFTRVSNGVWFILNGRKQFRNVSGGHLFMLGNGQESLVYRTSGYIHIQFSDNTHRLWHIARQHVFTGALGALVIAVDGFGTSGGYNNLVTWGHDRSNIPFFIRIGQSIVLRENCQWRLCSGIKEVDIPSLDQGATLTFGFDSNNQPVTGDDCPVKFKMDWHKNGWSGTIWLWL